VSTDPLVAVGVGACRGVTAAELDALIDVALDALGMTDAEVAVLATIELRAAEPGIVAVAARRGWTLVAFTAGELAAEPVPNPTAFARANVGTPSVAEAAAQRAARDFGGPVELIAAKRAGTMATVAVARGSLST
jgi:cobalt-precorrin 5A hydrolase/precorrin-3B C17-methyltransferase